MKILITGASGFIGSFLVEEALRRGMETWAGVRATSSRTWLKESSLHFVELDMTKPERLKAQLQAHRDERGAWDYVVHCAGATKCRREADFDRTNFEATRNLVDALRELHMEPKQFVFMSSLSVYGPVHEDNLELSISRRDTPRPNTAYGRSKLKAERYLEGLEGFPYVIFRPTGVYGPRERDYFMMVQSVARHVDVSVGFRPQILTFVYVADVVQAVFLAIDKGVKRRSYFVSDGGVYASTAFSELIQQELGVKHVFRITLPLWILWLVSALVGGTAHLLGRSSTLNRDKYKIMKQRNWQCDITPLQTELGYVPQYDLARGVKETIAWYKKERWI